MRRAIRSGLGAYLPLCQKIHTVSGVTRSSRLDHRRGKASVTIKSGSHFGGYFRLAEVLFPLAPDSFVWLDSPP